MPALTEIRASDSRLARRYEVYSRDSKAIVGHVWAVGHAEARSVASNHWRAAVGVRLDRKAVKSWSIS